MKIIQKYLNYNEVPGSISFVDCVGIWDLAIMAYMEVLRDLDKAPIIDEVVAIYTQLVYKQTMSMFQNKINFNELNIKSESQEFYDLVDDYSFECIADAYNYISNICAGRKLALRRKIYDDDTFIVKDIYEVISAQIPLLKTGSHGLVGIHKEDAIKIYNENNT